METEVRVEHRPILVGEAPGGKGHDVLPALEGVAGRSLARLMEVDYDEYMRRTVRTNLFETPIEGKKWSAPRARYRALQLMTQFPHGSRVILLGTKVAEAFHASGFALYEWINFERLATGETFWVARCPHPSGRNRNLNDPRARAEFGRFLRETLSDRR
jgi:uracil-DNA glycosylase